MIARLRCNAVRIPLADGSVHSGGDGAAIVGQQPLVVLPPLPPEAALRPLIKFVGGKRWIVPFVRVGIRLRLSARRGTRYVEPFCGGLAVGLYVGWPATVANDVSPDLIDCYRAVATDPVAVAAALDVLIAKTPADDLDRRVVVRGREVLGPVYHAVRAAYNAGDGVRPSGPTRAAQFLYLASRCFNGILRVNRAGKFNVPVSDARSPCYPARADLVAFAWATRDWTWRCADFEAACDDACRGDVLYADPPYRGTFAGYAAGGFRDADQVRLVDALARARGRGVAILHTNADTPEIRALYRGRGFWMLPTAELRAVNSDGEGRKRVGCLIVSNAPELLAMPEDGDE